MSSNHGPGCPHPHDSCTYGEPTIEVYPHVLKTLLEHLDLDDWLFECTYLECSMLRELAVLVGLDPWDFTPHQYRTDFCSGHDWTEWRKGREIFFDPERRGPQLHAFFFRNCTICKTHERAEIGEPQG